MSVYIERKYLGHIQFKLEQFKQKNTDLYNFRCPLCLDSKKNRTKARGYVYRKGNDYFYRCHNCGVSITFGSLLKEMDAQAYKAYILERYTNGSHKNAPVKKPDLSEYRGNAFSYFASVSRISIPKISELPDGHYAKEYIRSRKIPLEFWDELLYTDNFRSFMDSDFPEHGKDELPEDDRVVMLYKNESGSVTNVAGRALGDTKLRYLTVKITDEKKVFGLHRLSKKDRVYVVEGQFDSLFLPNAVASGDSNLSGVAEHLADCDAVLVYDNEPRNKEIVRQIGKSIDNSYKVCLFPEGTPGKDINEMVMNGMSKEEIKQLIDENTYSGLTAKLKFTTWKKC